MPILYTPGQLMTALGLSKQQWRTYRSALPELNKGPGHAPCYAPEDILAVAMAQTIAETLSCPISRLKPFSKAFFSICRRTSWPQLERSWLALNMVNARVELMDAGAVMKSSVCVSVAFEPVVASLQKALFNIEPEKQRNLAFPPMVAGGRAS